MIKLDSWLNDDDTYSTLLASQNKTKEKTIHRFPFKVRSREKHLINSVTNSRCTGIQNLSDMKEKLNIYKIPNFQNMD